jgi:hypothetical protein
MFMAKKGWPAYGAAGVCTSTSRVWDADQARKRSKIAFGGNFTCVSYVLVPGRSLWKRHPQRYVIQNRQ